MNKRTVDERFIAKTRPSRKDIQWHTDDLLNNFELLRELYPNLFSDWELLRLACIYHDLGKMNAVFQSCVHRKSSSTGMPHGLLSLGFIDVEYLGNEGYSENDIKLLFHAVAYHHERQINLSLDDIYREIGTLTDIFKEFEYGKLPSKYLDPEFDRMFYTPGKRFYESQNNEYFFRYVMLKGLLNRLDYAASAEIPVEHRNDFLTASMERLAESWKKENPENGWNELQLHMLEHREENVIIIAQTGMGKTEAGLLWLGQGKGFFTLPLKSAINSIYKRIKNNLVTEDIENRVGLLHSDTLKIYHEAEKDGKSKTFYEEPDSQLESYYNSTKQLSLPLTICTLDQIFDFVYRYKGFEPKLATLSYSKIIIDEIQMYSPELVAYLIIGLSYITKLGGRYAILTATLPGIILDFMKSEGINPPKPVKFTNDRIRHSVKILEADIDSDESISQMAEAFCRNKILIICNTIKKSKAVYEKMKERLAECDKGSIHLLHSGFIRQDRNEKEDMILEAGKKGSTKCEIWVSTQLVEASLDIDFDLLFTELSDLNGLFQRMGRCYRHRTLHTDYNCFVFTGGSKKCSGVGKNSVIEPMIHELSKTAVKEIDGKITEDEKVDLIENTYSAQRLAGTEYYGRIKQTLQDIKDIPEFEYTKQDVNKMFRDIDQISVIPQCIYQQYKADIRKNIEILKDKSGNRTDKIEAREAIRDLMVPVQSRLALGTVCSNERIENGLEIIVVDAEYSFDTGISFENTGNKEFKDVESRMF